MWSSCRLEVSEVPEFRAHRGAAPGPAIARRSFARQVLDEPNPADRGRPMSTAKSAAKKSTGRRASAAPDAVKLLVQDHKEVKALFKQYDKLVKAEADDDEKQTIAQEICTQLSVHATVEEELFYPAAREVLGDEVDLVDEADVEHASAKDLIAQLEAASPADDDHYDAKVKVLGEYIDHHVKEEEGEMFPKLKKTELDLEALGEQIATRKEQLLARLGAAAAQH
jgi:hemerythrin superfamily protein